MIYDIGGYVMAKKSIDDIKARAEQILRQAEESGADESFYFINTFRQYQTQLHILDELSRVIEQEGTLSTKEYVKGRENVYIHPAVREYNNTANSVNKTVDTLIKIVKEYNSTEGEEDELIKALKGAGLNA